METFFLLNLYQDNVISYLTDTIPWYYIFTFSAPKTTKSAWSRNNKRSNSPCFTVKFHINRRSQATAGTDINDFLLF